MKIEMQGEESLLTSGKNWPSSIPMTSYSWYISPISAILVQETAFCF